MLKKPLATEHDEVIGPENDVSMEVLWAKIAMHIKNSDNKM